MPWGNPRNFVKDISLNSNIIYPTDTLEQNFKYIHRTFREFFAALELSRWSKEKRKEFVASVFFKQGWSEVLVLLGGLVNDVNEYVGLLLNGPPDLALRSLKEIESLDASLAKKVLQLRSIRQQDRKKVFTQFVKKLKSKDTIVDVLWAYLKSSNKDIPRVDMYFIQEILTWCNIRIPDNLSLELFRYLPEVPNDLLKHCNCMGENFSFWCDVPKGNCLIGSPADDPDTKPWVSEITEIYISGFQISRILVTNLIYELFDPKHRKLRDFQKYLPLEELDYHPVIRVSWYEAEMFCRWLSQKNQGVRLPTEFEWEKAASWTGSEKLRFPWGNDWVPDYLNTWEKGPNHTTKVGIYPNGASPCGALDMAGNVWEWCFDWYNDNLEDYFNNIKKFKKDPIGPHYGKRKIDRGGGWYHDVGKPCTFLRAVDDPGDIFSHCGFRIVKSEVEHKICYDIVYELNNKSDKLNVNRIEKSVSSEFKQIIDKLLQIIS